MKTKTLQEQIDKFYKETGYQLKVKDGRPYYDNYLSLYNRKISELPDNLVVDGNLDLRYSNVTKLPNNLVVGGSLCIENTNIDELPENLVVGGNLFLKHTKITELPDNLVVGGNLDLYGTEIIDLSDNLVVGNCLYIRNSKVNKLPDNLVVGGGLSFYKTKITKLPDNLVVGVYLDLYGTKITKLPENLVVGGNLNLDDTDITSLPENLVVEGCLFLKHTKITELPESLVVGHSLDFRGTKISSLPDNLVVGGKIYGGIAHNSITHTLTKEAEEKLQRITSFLQWKVGGKTYIKTDGIFSVVDSHRGNVWRTHRIGEDETLYVVTDGEGHYAHGKTLKEAKADLIYKINDRDMSSYEHLSLDDELSFEEAIAMYRTITGACSAGTRDFVENRLPEPHKEKYTIREIIDLTDGEYGSEKLKEFFKISEC